MTELLKDADGPEPPRCWNRPPAPKETRRFGLDSRTGDVIEVVLSNEWFEDKCRTWDGVGIGQPTAEYPSGTPYPVAHGWLPWCRQCKWMPEDKR